MLCTVSPLMGTGNGAKVPGRIGPGCREGCAAIRTEPCGFRVLREQSIHGAWSRDCRDVSRPVAKTSGNADWEVPPSGRARSTVQMKFRVRRACCRR